MIERHPPPSPRRAARGFSLVEVLVALLVLAIPLLALGLLQAQSQRSSVAAFQRTLAEVQALDMAERMWLDLQDPEGELDAWRSTHETSLPGWEGTVENVPGDPDLYRIRIEWSSPASAGGRAGFEHQVRLPRVAP